MKSLCKTINVVDISEIVRSVFRNDSLRGERLLKTSEDIASSCKISEDVVRSFVG